MTLILMFNPLAVLCPQGAKQPISYVTDCRHSAGKKEYHPKVASIPHYTGFSNVTVCFSSSALTAAICSLLRDGFH